MSTTPLTPGSYSAIPIHPHPESEPSTPPHNHPTPTRYFITVFSTILFTFLALFACSSITRPTSTRATFPIRTRTQMLPDKTPTTIIADTFYSVEWRDIDGSIGESYQARAQCASGTSVSKCLCNPIAINSRLVCASVLYAAPYADSRTSDEGCYCVFRGDLQCRNAGFTMFVDCQPR